MFKEIEKDLEKSDGLTDVFESLEKEGKFDSNIHPVDWDFTLPVTKDFPYIPKGWLKVKYALTNFFIVKPFTWYQAKVVYRVKTIGKHNLKGIKSAIVTSNHVAIFDCLVNAYALKPKKVKTVGAEFNNRKGRFGGYMRVGGMLPLGSKREVMREFSKALEYYINKGQYIMFYPEQSMWDLYEKPRPYKTGAFHYAIKHDIPTVPMFLTFRPHKKDPSKRYFTLNITEPLYPDKTLSLTEQAKDLADRAYNACVAVYEKAYGKKLEYSK